jgi:hypothetical protein
MVQYVQTENETRAEGEAGRFRREWFPTVLGGSTSLVVRDTGVQALHTLQVQVDMEVGSGRKRVLAGGGWGEGRGLVWVGWWVDLTLPGRT